MEEYGGYRIGKVLNPQKIESRGLSDVATGNNFVSSYGAAGLLMGDQFYSSGVIYDKDVQEKLKEMGAPKSENPLLGEYDDRLQQIQKILNLKDEEIQEVYYFSPPKFDGTATPEQMDAQSFVMLKKLQETVMDHTNKKSGDVAYGLQSLHGYGTLPYLYIDGEYGKDMEVRYDSKGDMFTYADGKSSGISGRDYPIYGYTLAYYIKTLHDDPRIREILPENAKTPVTDSVIKYFEKN